MNYNLGYGDNYGGDGYSDCIGDGEGRSYGNNRYSSIGSGNGNSNITPDVAGYGDGDGDGYGYGNNIGYGNSNESVDGCVTGSDIVEGLLLMGKTL